MNDKDKESFEKWRLEYISTNKGYFKMIGTDDLAQVAWQAACCYKQKEIYKLQAENAKLIEKVQRTKLFLKERLSYVDDNKDELFINKYCLIALLEELEKE
jgi:hypothetical protein